MAKAWCSDASRRVMATGLQVHGGIGFTWEHDMHLYVKRAQLDQVSYGDAAFHRDRIATLSRRASTPASRSPEHAGSAGEPRCGSGLGRQVARCRVGRPSISIMTSAWPSVPWAAACRWLSFWGGTWHGQPEADQIAGD